MLADFREAFHAHPGALPVDEAVLLLGQIVADPMSRTYAALAGWRLRLGPWLQMLTLGALSGSAEQLTPPLVEARQPRHAAEEVDAAVEVLRRHSAIPTSQ